MTKLCPRGKAAAKRKFKVYPSAYANAYASKICAGKIKDPSGVKRKDFRGPKPSGGGGTGKASRKIRKAGMGALIAGAAAVPIIGKMLKKKRRKSGTVQASGQVNPVTGEGMDKTEMGNTNEKMMAAIKNMKGPFGSKKGGMKVKKAGLGLMMMAGKKNRRKLGKAMKKNKLQLAAPGLYGMTQLKDGGMPESTGSHIQQDIDGQSFTNASAQAYYKDLLK